VENFWHLNLISYPQDIFNLNYDKIENLEGWGKLSVTNLKFSINEKKQISLDRFIYSLGIRHIGQENAKLIARHLRTIVNFSKLADNKNIENLSNIDGIGSTQIQSIKKFFLDKTNLKVLFELNKDLKIKNSVLINNKGLLKDKTFMLTGKLNGVSRAEAKSLIEKNSGKIISNVNKKLDYLIAGDKATIKKVKTAKELNIKVINQKELMKMLNKTS
jgi:DNA ligase (NAD+)